MPIRYSTTANVSRTPAAAVISLLAIQLAFSSKKIPKPEKATVSTQNLFQIFQ